MKIFYISINFSKYRFFRHCFHFFYMISYYYFCAKLNCEKESAVMESEPNLSLKWKPLKSIINTSYCITVVQCSTFDLFIYYSLFT